MSMFPRARPTRDGRNGAGRRKRSPRPVRRCVFIDSGSRDWRGIEICAACDMPRDDRRHDVPETHPDAVEIDRRKTGESEVDG